MSTLGPIASAAILSAPVVVAVAIAYWPSRDQLDRRRRRRAYRRARTNAVPRQRTTSSEES
ncbi:hypothetical protein ACFVYP_06865 [Kitasatospora sp. NPDC058201]|uniref:hypothetical protein n=1 Tax=unclassified Kitasatospora TaxID=2633591 RepID=UPI00366719A5